jgi:hypothetical protein
MARPWPAIRCNKSMGFIGDYTDSLDIRISFAVANYRFRAQCRRVCEVSLIPSPSLFVRPALARTFVTATFTL